MDEVRSLSNLERVRAWGSDADVFELGPEGTEPDGAWWVVLRAADLEIMLYQGAADPRLEAVLALPLEAGLAAHPRLEEALLDLEERRPALLWFRPVEGELEIRWRLWDDGLNRHALNVAVLELAMGHRVLTRLLEELHTQRASEATLSDLVRGMGRREPAAALEGPPDLAGDPTPPSEPQAASEAPEAPAPRGKAGRRARKPAGRAGDPAAARPEELAAALDKVPEGAPADAPAPPPDALASLDLPALEAVPEAAPEGLPPARPDLLAVLPHDTAPESHAGADQAAPAGEPSAEDAPPDGEPAPEPAEPDMLLFDPDLVKANVYGRIPAIRLDFGAPPAAAAVLPPPPLAPPPPAEPDVPAFDPFADPPDQPDEPELEGELTHVVPPEAAGMLRLRLHDALDTPPAPGRPVTAAPPAAPVAPPAPAPTRPVCPACGRENPPGSRFCAGCGTRLAPPG